MALEDREYVRTQPVAYATGPSRMGSVGLMQWDSVTAWLIGINVAVFIINNVLVRRLITAGGEVVAVLHPIYEFGYFSEAMAVWHGQAWRFITFQFLHANLMHILFNMVALYFFGPLVEMYLGRVRYLVFYLLCGIAGPISLMGFRILHLHLGDEFTPLIGASAGIFGVLIAAAEIVPDATVLIYGIIPAKLKAVAWVLLAIAIWTTLTSGHNAGGEAAHLGGAAMGFILMRFPGILSVFGSRRRRTGQE